MTGAAYTNKDFSLSNNPDIAPEVVEAAIKLQYRKQLKGRNLLDYKPLTVSTTTTIEEDETSGEVNWLSENGGLPKLDFTFVKSVKRVRPYGGYFEVSEEQQEDGASDEIRVMVNNVAYSQAYFEDLLVYYDIINAPGINSIDAANPWDVITGASAGDPPDDIQHAKAVIRQVTKMEADTIVLSELAVAKLTKYDWFRNRLYNAYDAQGYLITARLPPILGLNPFIDDAIDPANEGRALVCKAVDIGIWEERKAITTRNIPGYLLGKDNVAFKYTAKAKGEPNIKQPKLGCIINGLFSEEED